MSSPLSLCAVPSERAIYRCMDFNDNTVQALGRQVVDNIPGVNLGITITPGSGTW
jgi:hypothetical protein